jgi:hypothetical protein
MTPEEKTVTSAASNAEPPVKPVEAFSLSVRWTEPEGPPVSVNQFVIQLVPGPDGLPDEMLLIPGYVAPPLLTGTADEQRKAIQATDHLTINPLVRFTLTRKRAGELLNGLIQALTNWDEAESKSQEIIEASASAKSAMEARRVE